MVVVHFFEKKNLVLTQLLKQFPTVDENIKIKGRKGKVVSVEKVDNNIIHVHVLYEEIKKKPVVSETKGKKR